MILVLFKDIRIIYIQSILQRPHCFLFRCHCYIMPWRQTSNIPICCRSNCLNRFIYVTWWITLRTARLRNTLIHAHEILTNRIIIRLMKRGLKALCLLMCQHLYDRYSDFQILDPYTRWMNSLVYFKPFLILKIWMILLYVLHELTYLLIIHTRRWPSVMFNIQCSVHPVMHSCNYSCIVSNTSVV